MQVADRLTETLTKVYDNPKSSKATSCRLSKGNNKALLNQKNIYSDV